MTAVSGRFGPYGGAYVPETVMPALDQLIEAMEEAAADAGFQAQLQTLLHDYAGRPTPMTLAPRLAAACGGAQIWLKREDLLHTGAHKINNALGQVLLAERMGKRRIIAETGAGQHGVATATACARAGLQCTVYMGREDMRRQALNVYRMKLLGTTVVPVDSGAGTLKDATNEAIRDWVSNVRDTHYVIGSSVGPHPYPSLVRSLQRVIGDETRAECLSRLHRLPHSVVACVGGGSNAIGMFAAFLEDREVRLVGVEAAGHGLDSGEHAAPLTRGRPGVLHGSHSYLMQDEHGQVLTAHSISAGLDYPGVGPEHSALRDSGRVGYVCASDEQAVRAFHRLCRLEGIIPALESSHALHAAEQIASELPAGATVVVCLSGRGDKDIGTVRAHDGDNDDAAG
ncbi:MAG: tryptophan synthase subunit beta [Candidatus Dormibacteraeota bacterium]|uniref:Tryptophan synthase beta chain n=1 Tax=Candidatus Amunia macphersoniae TaxID=3127014 RepID=A0A934KK58_9BACT|nr:tryptophan synthase subunit beta [Candidatus Dormibacteraeota bacterium]